MSGSGLQNALGEARMAIELERWPMAEQAARRVLALDPQHLEAMGLLSQSLIGQARYDESRRTAFLMVAQSPEEEWGYRLLAIASVELGDTDQALATIAEAARLCPEQDITLFALCDIQVKARLKKEALQTATRFLQLHPDNVQAHKSMAEVARLRRKWKECIEHAEAALSIEPENQRALYLLGFAQMKKGRLVESIETYHRGAALFPHNEQLRSELKWTTDHFVGSAWPAAVISVVAPGAILYFLWDMFIGKRMRIARLSAPAKAFVQQRLRLRNSLVLREAALLLSTAVWVIWSLLWLNDGAHAPEWPWQFVIFAGAVVVSFWSAWSTMMWLKRKRALL